MASKLLCISGFLFLTLAARAATVVSEDAKVPKHYVQPVIGNGSICTSVDFEGEQVQKKYRSYYPEVVWAGRRYARTDNNSALITMGHYKTDITVNGKPLGKLLSWTQRLDRENALVGMHVLNWSNGRNTYVLLHFDGYELIPVAEIPPETMPLFLGRAAERDGKTEGVFFRDIVKLQKL